MVTSPGKWVFLLYRLPREPSAPRLAVWRALRRLGAHLVSDGLVALPESPRNLEHFEWLAAGVDESGGVASVWVAEPRTPGVGAAFTDEMQRGVNEEYAAILRDARECLDSAEPERRRTLRRLRGQLRRVASRDYFAAPAGAEARAAVEALAVAEREKVPA